MEMDFLSRFAPHENIASQLLPFVSEATDDGSHDLSHILRVWQNVRALSALEGGDMVILTAATLLHDCVEVPKNAPLRSSASRMAAERASQLLSDLGWDQDAINNVAHAIEAHSFSANVAPTTVEARILQDADRLDAIGHIGIARCFYVSGRLNRSIYDPADPDASRRALDDSTYAIDHFRTKLLHLAGSFKTETGARMAKDRHAVIQKFLDGLLREISADPAEADKS